MKAVTKIRRHKRPTPYYSNSSSSQRLILSGDIEQNPGPITSNNNLITNKSKKKSLQKTSAPVCETCSKTIRCNSKTTMCIHCKNLTHLSCTQSKTIRILNSRIPCEWTCNNCLFKELPFHNIPTIMNEERTEIDDYSNIHIEKIREHSKYLSIAHLNTQSMSSTFDEFQVMLKQNPFDIITLSETWLKDNKHLLEYVKINGYNFSFKNRDEKRGGGVGVYIRNDFNKLDETIEQLWIEIKNKNKKSSFLVETFYQPSSNDQIKLDWINKFESVLSVVTTTFDGSIIIAGDMNINLKKQSNVSETYIQCLNNFDLSQRIKIPTRNGSKLIDHIITNIPKKILYSNVLPCPTVSDHDAPYIIVNVPTDKFEPRYKYIRNLKNFNLNSFMESFKTLPLSLIYAFDDPVDQLDTLNKIVLDCLEEHAPLIKAKFTRPSAPWMKDLDIVELQNKRDKLRYEAHQNQTTETWSLFRQVRNEIKQKINQTKTIFYKKLLSSKNSKDTWNIIHRILKPSNPTIKANVNDLNEFFNSTSERTTGRKPTNLTKIYHYISKLPSENDTQDLLKHTTSDEVFSDSAFLLLI